jgi:PadR family transcriptional regulator AphA
MDVRTLCLGALTEGDRTGYEIKRRFEEAFNYFFGASFGSIYPALADLTREGLVTCTNVEQTKRPDKKVYSLTPAGQRALIDDLMATPPRHKVRSEFLVLMYFAHLLPPVRVAQIIDEMLAMWRPLVAELERCCSAEVAAGDQPISPGMRFAAGYGRAVMSAALGYVQEHKQPLLRALADQDLRQPLDLAGD